MQSAGDCRRQLLIFNRRHPLEDRTVLRKSIRPSFARPAGLLRGVAALAFSSIPAAQAYIDPGTGSMLLQVFGAAVAGGIFFFHELRLKIMGFFSRRPAAPAPTAEEQSADDRLR